ncbi:MAG: hypothetical protein QHJ73_11735 [Armatimonadota bacterium]|nr:hypothetical protein [Armatimonadota bacterium]
MRRWAVVIAIGAATWGAWDPGLLLGAEKAKQPNPPKAAKEVTKQSSSSKAAKEVTKPGGAKSAATPKPGPKPFAVRFAEELGLSPEQKKKSERIMQAHAEKARAIREDKSLSEEKKREKMMQLWQKTRAELDAVLTPQQREKAKAMETRRGEEVARRFREETARALGLTEAQQAKMKAIQESYAPKLRAIWGDPKLSPEAKHAKVKPLMEEMRQKMDALLTPAQRKKAEELRKRGPARPPVPR